MNTVPQPVITLSLLCGNLVEIMQYKNEIATPPLVARNDKVGDQPSAMTGW